jgi:hypothetical protein
MKILGVAALLALLAVPAHAQMMPGAMNLIPEDKFMTPEEKEQDAIRQKAYRDSLRSIPDNKASSDPWGNVRSDAPKAPAKQPRTKTGSAAR